MLKLIGIFAFLAFVCRIGSGYVTTARPQTGVCVDTYDTFTCSYFKQYKLCFLLQEQCKKTCNHCACEDHPGLDCAFYKKHRLCPFVEGPCKRTCGLCTPTITKKPTIPPTTKPRTKPPAPKGTCGRSNVQQSRIIAGVDAKKGAWPWIASMTLKNSVLNTRFHFCGGSLIHPEWVLTAAHCVDFINKTDKAKMKSFEIGLGVHNRSDLESSVQYIGVKDFYIHHTWSDRANQGFHDVALVHLKRPALLSNRVNTVCLPRKNQKPKSNSVCYLAGWGTVKHPGNSPEVLQQAYMPVVSESHCFGAAHMICTGYGNSSKTNACRGDSGGPLMCRNKDSSWTVHGIASFVVEYCKYYTGFADVGIYLDWIRKFVKV